MDAQGNLFPNEVTKSFYEGIPGAIDLASHSETYLVRIVSASEEVKKDDLLYVDEKTNTKWVKGLLIDRSWLTYADGKPILDVNSVDVARILNGDKRINYRGEEIYVLSDDRVAHIIYEEIRNANGDVYERHIGSVKDIPAVMSREDFLNGKYLTSLRKGSFVPETKYYKFYELAKNEGNNSLWGYMGIATWTIKTYVDTNGRESIASYSNNTTVHNGYIYYKAKEGYARTDIDKMLEDVLESERHHKLEEYLRDKRDVAFRWSQAREDRLNGWGKQAFGLIGSRKFDQHDFSADNSAQYISFSRYPDMGDDRVSHQSFTYPVERDKEGRDYRGI